MKKNRRLRVLRAEHELSQMEVAERAGIALNRFWRIENGYSQPSDDERRAIAHVFDLSPAEVFVEALAS